MIYRFVVGQDMYIKEFGFSSPTEFSIDFQSVNWYQHYAYYGTHDITLYTLGADHGTLVVDECYTRCR